MNGIVFIGTTGNFTYQPLLELLKKYNVTGIVESLPRKNKQGLHFPGELVKLLRHQLPQKTSLKNIAAHHNIPYFKLTSHSMENFTHFLKSVDAELGCIASMYQLLPMNIIESFPKGIINIHPSLLPNYRGPNAWFWHYFDMAREGGTTIHFLDENMDTGDIIKQKSFAISLGMSPYKFMQTAIDNGTEMLIETLDDILQNNDIQRIPQSHLPCTQKARYLKKNEELFLWDQWDIKHCFHFLSGVYPWYNAFSKMPFPLYLFKWKAVSYLINQTKRPTGKILIDKKGFFFSHPEGKIYIKPIIRPLIKTLIRLVTLALIIYILIKELI